MWLNKQKISTKVIFRVVVQKHNFVWFFPTLPRYNCMGFNQFSMKKRCYFTAYQPHKCKGMHSKGPALLTQHLTCFLLVDLAGPLGGLLRPSLPLQHQ